MRGTGKTPPCGGVSLSGGNVFNSSEAEKNSLSKKNLTTTLFFYARMAMKCQISAFYPEAGQKAVLILV